MVNTNEVVSNATTRANKAELSQISTDGMSVAERLEMARVRPTDSVEADPVVIWVKGEPEQGPFGTLGNFSLITGKAKSKKSFTLAFAVASAIKGSTYDAGPFTCQFPDNKCRVVYFDTEQGRNRVWKAVKRVCRMAGVDDPEHLEVYDLRQYDPAERIEMINERLTVQNPEKNIGLVIVDGCRDLLHNFNDPEESSRLASHFMKWTAGAQCHLATVLHQNKGDNNARGHLGAELTNKAETVITVEIHSADKSISVVKPSECRDIDFNSFGFTINEHGLPELLPDFVIEANGKKERKKTEPREFEDQSHHFVLAAIFKDGNPVSGKDELLTKIKLNWGAVYSNIGETMAKKIKEYWTAKGWIVNKGSQGKTAIYVYRDAGLPNPV